MQTLGLALTSRGDEGEPLPSLFKQFQQLGIYFRRGWLHLVAGAPGGGKSALLSYLALHNHYYDGTPVPTLYFSADNDKMTFGCAAISSTLGIHTNVAEEKIERGDDDVIDVLDKSTDHLWVSFEAAPSPNDIRMEIDAFATVYGEYPHMIVVDNLVDVQADMVGEGHSRDDAILDFLKRKARETGSAMVVLAHVTGWHTDGTEPIPRSGLMNKIDKRPQLVLTLFEPSGTDHVLGVSVVKNRRGDARTDGTMYADIFWSPEMANFKG